MAKKSKKIVKEEKVIEASSETEEKSISEEDLETSGLSDLLDKGKDQGFLTYQDINSMLPEDISDPDQVEETIQMLIDIGIEVIESVQGAGEDNSEVTLHLYDLKTKRTKKINFEIHLNTLHSIDLQYWLLERATFKI